MKKIIDVSKYQENIDYQAVKNSGIEGVILRAGLTYWGKQNKAKDEYFDKHYAGFKAVGMPIGAYYYSAADSIEQAKSEALACMNYLQGKEFELPIYYDVENEQRMGKLSKRELTDIVKTFCDKLEYHGYFVGVYANTNYFENKLYLDELGKKYTLWLADYRKEPNRTIPRDILQYTDKGKVTGIVGNIDLNECYRDFSVIERLGLNGFVKTDKKSVEEVAKEVIAGVWGNGQERVSKLTNAGYDYNVIQDIVNKTVSKKSNEQVAKEVIQGLWGNGNERKARLESAGYDYKVIQDIVNKLV